MVRDASIGRYCGQIEEVHKVRLWTSAPETINGVPVTENQIAEWAAEAEIGYEVEGLKKRGRGHPGRGAEPTQVVALRLTAEELASVDAVAEREHKTRSELIREALAKYAGRSAGEPKRFFADYWEDQTSLDPQ